VVVIVAHGLGPWADSTPALPEETLNLGRRPRRSSTVVR